MSTEHTYFDDPQAYELATQNALELAEKRLIAAALAWYSPEGKTVLQNAKDHKEFTDAAKGLLKLREKETRMDGRISEHVHDWAESVNTTCPECGDVMKLCLSPECRIYCCVKTGQRFVQSRDRWMNLEFERERGK